MCEAALCNLSETQHHYPQQDEAHFICLDDLLDGNISPNRELTKVHAPWPKLRCVAVALLCGLVLQLQLLTKCWLLVCLIAAVFMGLCGGCDSGCVDGLMRPSTKPLSHPPRDQETYVRFQKHITNHGHTHRDTAIAPLILPAQVVQPGW